MSSNPDLDGRTTLYEPIERTPIPGEPRRFNGRVLDDRELLERVLEEQQELRIAVSQVHLTAANSGRDLRESAQRIEQMAKHMENLVLTNVAEMRDRQRKISDDLRKVEDRTERRIELLREQVAGELEEQKQRIDKHSDGVRQLENTKVAVTGAWSALRIAGRWGAAVAGVGTGAWSVLRALEWLAK